MTDSTATADELDPVRRLRHTMAMDMFRAMERFAEELGRRASDREAAILWAAIQRHHGIPEDVIEPASARQKPAEARYAETLVAAWAAVSDKLGRPLTNEEMTVISRVMMTVVPEVDRRVADMSSRLDALDEEITKRMGEGA